MSAFTKYQDALVNHPVRGGGLHQHIMAIACLGVLSEIPANEIIRDIYGIDKVKKNEPEDAVKKALSSVKRDSDYIAYKPRPISRFAPKTDNALEKFIDGVSPDMFDLMDLSPIGLINSTDRDASLILETLYKPTDYLFIGDVFDRSVKRVSDWLSEDLAKYPHIIPNPMTGKVGVTDTGKKSMRCEATVKNLRFAVCEMDAVDIDSQVAFWVKCISIGVPVASVIHSGSKSLHGWIKVDCGNDSDKWEKDVKGWLFNDFGKMYGFDSACSNKARLSRLPSHKRKGKEQQRLLYLNGAA